MHRAIITVTEFNLEYMNDFSLNTVVFLWFSRVNIVLFTRTQTHAHASTQKMFCCNSNQVNMKNKIYIKKS